MVVFLLYLLLDELPLGSVPRNIDVIIRGEAVESAQPGDHCDFLGTLIVVPDVSMLSAPGNFIFFIFG